MLLGGHKIVYFGHSAFLILTKGGHSILIDPWISNPSNNRKLEEFTKKVDLILITHGHGDHLGDAIEIAKKYDSEVISSYEITNYLRSKGVSKVTGMNIGGTVHREEVQITMVEATHSSTIYDGDKILPGGAATGFIVTLDNGHKIYHMGDTGLFCGLNYIAELYKPNVILIPIGGHFTMGLEEAAYAIKILKPDIIIPMHYKTFPVIDAEPSKLETLLPEEFKNKIQVLKPGEFLE